MLQVGFYLLLILILIVLGLGFNKAAVVANYSTDKRKRFIRGYSVFMICWIAYVHIISASGIIADLSLPPKFPIFLIIPAFAIIIWFFNAKKFKPIISSFPIVLTVYYQTFRIFVELLIWGMALKEIGPMLVTFEGNNFDILAGLTAPIIGYLAYSRKVLSHKAVIVWNICSILILANIVFIFLSLVVMPEFWGYAQTPFTLEVTTAPYTLIASVYMPSAVFMHVFSIKKSLKELKANA